MATNNTLKFIAFTAGAFLGGVITGLLISPKSGSENRKWISENKGEFSHWADQKGHELKTKTDEQLSHLKENVKKSVKKSVPDLYEATEDFGLKEEDLEPRDSDA
ncbi:MAG: YtxH domain-containing protein [Cyclonatronaceae bacterium]